MRALPPLTHPSTVRFGGANATRTRRPNLVLCALLAGCAVPPRASADDPGGVQVANAEPTRDVSSTLAAPGTTDDQVSLVQDAEPDEPPLHHADEMTITMRAFYGIPILRRSLFWDGDGEVDTYGGGAFLHWYLVDTFALGLGLEGDVFKTPHHDAYGVEGQVAARWFPYSSPDLGVFVDGTAGYLQTTEQVPPGGTEWNFTFSFGPGVDVPLPNDTHLLIGGNYHHISNALGRQNRRNPSQNEFRFWVGLEWTW